MGEIYDLAVIGGGVNGCGVARDAAGRGLSVFLCEMNDLASGTSSWSTKLVHGGLRYLEHYEFRLVRESLHEREILWRAAPHLVGPLRFVLPYHRGLRPAWLLRLGLFLYDHIGGRKLLPPTRVLDLARHVAGGPLKPGLFSKGFEYSDCRVDDARLVVMTARDAADRGAIIAPRTKAIAAARGADGWTLTLEDARSGARRSSYQFADYVDGYYTRVRTDSATKLDWMGTLRARAGFLVMPSTLVYATGGLAYGQAKATLNINGAVMLDGYPNAVGNNVTETKTKTGWVLGAGIEQKLSARWTLKAEYLHYDLGKMTVTNWVDGINAWQCCTNPMGSVYKTNQYKLGGETVRVGLNYRFGDDGAPVVAKY